MLWSGHDGCWKQFSRQEETRKAMALANVSSRSASGRLRPVFSGTEVQGEIEMDGNG